ncbi:MAG: hypothetical protein ABSD38_31290 [Syntrophorhabdales bacterium]
MSQFDVPGINPGEEIADEEIAAVAEQKKEWISLKKGDTIILIGSDALMPDKEMTEGMEKYFSVSAFTGIPEQNKKDNASYAKVLRYAAAKAGIAFSGLPRRVANMVSRLLETGDRPGDGQENLLVQRSVLWKNR